MHPFGLKTIWESSIFQTKIGICEYVLNKRGIVRLLDNNMIMLLTMIKNVHNTLET